MAERNQAAEPETHISVDMNAADPSKAVTRSRSDLALEVRDNGEDRSGKSKLEKTMLKRMDRFGRNLTRQFDQKLAEREAAWQRERSALEAKVQKSSADRSTDDAADVAHEAAIGALREKLEGAMEKGDSKAVADITLQISKLDAQFWAKKAQAAGVVTRETTATTQAPPADTRLAPEQQGRRAAGPTSAGQRFIDANDWWEDPDYVAETAAANAIFLKLRDQEGFDAKSGEMYKEVAKQVRAKFPNLDVHAGSRNGGDVDEDEDPDDADAGPGGQTVRRAATARIEDRGSSGAPSSRMTGGKRTLTKQDIETIKACRMDPDNDAHVVKFLQERDALEASS